MRRILVEAGVSLLIAALLPALRLQAQNFPASLKLDPVRATGSVPNDADDPAIWVHPDDPAKSVIVGTDKDETQGGLYVWSLQGEQIQYIPLQRPNNVDIRRGVNMGAREVDIAVTNLRYSREIRVFEINRKTGTLIDITTEGGIKTPELETPYGLCLYKRPSDGALFVIESSKDGSSSNSLHQYRLYAGSDGNVAGKYVRSFGKNSIRDKVEGLVADDELGYIYAADEEVAVRKYYADPASGNNDQIVAFATEDDGFRGDREGISIYRCDAETGYIFVSSQKPDRYVKGRKKKKKKFSPVKVYRREGEPDNPHEHRLLATLETLGSLKTDGLAVISTPISPEFPAGLLVKHHATGRQFVLYDLEPLVAQNALVCRSWGSKP